MKKKKVFSKPFDSFFSEKGDVIVDVHVFYSLAALVRKILFCHSKIKFISSRHRVISSLSLSIYIFSSSLIVYSFIILPISYTFSVDYIVFVIEQEVLASH